MGLGDLFNKLAKLTIAAFKDPARGLGDRLGEPIEVQYNPESLSTKHESVFSGNRKNARFCHSQSDTLAVTLIFDGTGVDQMGIELLWGTQTVADRIKEFLTTCYRVHGDIHEPAYLRLTWGKGVLSPDFDCRLKSVDIKYSAFERNGSPLRAELNAVFVEHLDSAKNLAALRLSSPDLSHRRMVRTGDTLPLLCREIYGSSEHYLRVAAVNDLDDFRMLSPGQELIFPPFQRSGRH